MHMIRVVLRIVILDDQCGALYAVLMRVPASALLRAAPGKIGHKVSWKSRPEYISTNTYYSTGIKHGINTALAVVSHHQAAKLQSGVNK